MPVNLGLVSSGKAGPMRRVLRGCQAESARSPRSRPAPALADLLALPLGDIREICERPGGDAVQPEEIEPLAPVDGRTEVWAAGVTYERSRAARVLESEDSADVYDRVYAAERPEPSSSRRPGGFVALAAPCQSVPTRASTFPNPNWLPS